MQKKKTIKITDYPIYYVDIIPVMGAKGTSKDSFCRMARIAYDALQKYCKSEIKGVDLDVMSRVYKALGCDISEVIIKDEN